MALNAGFPRLTSDTDTFSDWLNKTNEMIDLMREDVVTANSTVANTTGSARVIGSVSTNTVYAGVISGGDVAAVSNLEITSNTAFTNSSIDVDVDVTIGGQLNYIINTNNLNNLEPTLSYSLGNTTNRWVGYFSNTFINGATLQINSNNTFIDSNTLSVSAESAFTNAATFSNTVNLNSTTTANNLNVTKDLNVTGNTSTGNLNVIGITNLNGSLDLDGDLTANNLVVTGTANIAFLEVAGLVANGVAMIGTSASVATNTPTVIDSFTKSQSLGLKYIIQGNNADVNSAYTVEIMCAHNNTTAFYTRYAELQNQFNITIAPVINGTDVELVATCPDASVANTHFLNIIRLETR